MLILNKLNEQKEKEGEILFSPQEKQIQSPEAKARDFFVLSAYIDYKPADLQRVLLFLPIEGTPKGYPVRFKFF